MKNLKQFGFVFLLGFMAIFTGCKKDANLEVVTKGCSNIGGNTAYLQGTVSYGGNGDITCGFYYDLNSDMSNALVSNSTNLSAGSFSVTLTGLLASTTYYYQAYALADGIVVKGDVKSFTTAESGTSGGGSGTGTVTVYNEVVSGNEGGHNYVDLGLPSGLRWATCNIGATNPEDNGNYYAWGETSPYNGSCTYIDNPTTLPSDRDAASVNWSGSWRMPTETEMKELIDNCTWQWITHNSVNGYCVTGPNGNSIFLPAAGQGSGYNSLLNVGDNGNYWTSSLYTISSGYVYYLNFSTSSYRMNNYDRSYGRSVRAVCQ